MGKTKTINSILVANRGEIAVRIIRTIQEMGLRSIAVYSDVDENALHVAQADVAVRIGPGPAAQSYLSIENVIKAATDTGADAIHPGYGFLSENPDFAKACVDADIVFIGPSIEAIKVMGNKARAKQRMVECGVPCIPGFDGEDQSDSAFVAASEDIGFPIMIKATAGGGGRGMRLVDEVKSFVAALHQARGEALSGFGSEELILEKAVTNARHIEFQIFGDRHGNIIHLGERDCSLQRRHQKVIEEAPSPAVDDDLRKRMGDAAIKAAQSVSYEGAGTVEFLLDENTEFFFLEMNTRLQVEHPVTEMVTGLDLVEWQIRVAQGEKLPLAQEEVKFTGHAIEARLYAEDPARGFLPSMGKVIEWRAPNIDGVRVDCGIYSSAVISSHYDALVAKIVSHEPNRKMAINQLQNALCKTVLFGPEHNKEFLQQLLNDDEFIQAGATTNLIGERLTMGHLGVPPPSTELICLAAVTDFNEKKYKAFNSALTKHFELSNWSSSPLPPTCFTYVVSGDEYEVILEVLSDNLNRVHIADKTIDISTSPSNYYMWKVDAKINGKKYPASAWQRSESGFFISFEGRDYRFSYLEAAEHSPKNEYANGVINTPMPGTLVEIFVKIGTSVSADSSIAILEAMKMRHEILAGVAGVVKAVHHEAGAQVSAGDLLFEIEEESPDNATS